MIQVSIGVLGLSATVEGVLLVQVAYDPGVWRLPGGFLEARETPEGALRREIHEELGCESEVGSLIGVYYKVYDSNINLIFTLNLHGEPTPDGREVVEAVRWKPELLPERISARHRKVIDDWRQIPALSRVWTFRSPNAS